MDTLRPFPVVGVIVELTVTHSGSQNTQPDSWLDCYQLHAHVYSDEDALQISTSALLSEIRHSIQ